jgi:hypothetical protein
VDEAGWMKTSDFIQAYFCMVNDHKILWFRSQKYLFLMWFLVITICLKSPPLCLEQGYVAMLLYIYVYIYICMCTYVLPTFTTICLQSQPLCLDKAMLLILHIYMCV